MFFPFDNTSDNSELLLVLNGLMENWENEIVEFKEANNDFDKNKIGQYFSAISNEANLKEQQFGWLVFGVRNKDKKIVGSTYRDTSGLEKLKQEIAQSTTGGISFIDIFEVPPIVDGEEKRVIMFKIPAAATAIPTGWNNHYYGRNGESLSALSIEEQDRIRGQQRKDWSKQLVEESSIKNLDKAALVAARENYKKKLNKPHISEEIDALNDEEFLTKIKLMINGKLTNAAMVLLGNSDYDYLMDTPPKIMWRLYDSKGNDKDYEIFDIPFLTVVDRVYAKVRNLTYRYMPDQLTLFPVETQQYDTWLLRELMNNCIAHQDYTIGGRIYLDEHEDKVVISNPGSFLPGNVQCVLTPNYSPPFYRNQVLAQAMVNFHMIDTGTFGVRRIFRIQKEKYFPMPDYDTNNPGRVLVTVHGKTLDENYTRVLFKNQNFDLNTVYSLDRVQKSLPIGKEDLRMLRSLGVVEGKAPHIYVSASVATIIDEKAQYIKNRGFDDEYYKDMIVKYIKQFGKASRKEIRDLLSDKLPSVLSEKHKNYKIGNLLTSLKKEEKIRADSQNPQKASWVLAK